MQEQINQLLIRIQDLETMVKLQQTNLNQNITWFWAILTFVVVALAGALVLLARTWVNTRVEKELRKLRSDFESNLKIYINEKFKDQFSSLSAQVYIENEDKVKITFPYKLDSSFETFHLLDLTINDEKPNFSYKIADTGLEITLKEKASGVIRWSILWLKEK